MLTIAMQLLVRHMTRKLDSVAVFAATGEGEHEWRLLMQNIDAEHLRFSSMQVR
jgi:UDP-N-acetylmuramyl tripeptide synthase